MCKVNHSRRKCARVITQCLRFGAQVLPEFAYGKHRREKLLRAIFRLGLCSAFAEQPRKLGSKSKKTNRKGWSFCFWSGLRGSNPPPPPWQGGALPNELNPQVWCLRSESNQRHGDFQSPALPTELQRHTEWRLGWGSNPRPLA